MKKKGVNSKNKKAQVWVETVIYTLIALVVIGLFISFAKPKIEEIQDKSIIEQSVSMLEAIDSIMLDIVQGGAGNQRVIDLGIKKGTLTIDGVNDQLSFVLEGKYTYTEPGDAGAEGSPVNVGNVIATTSKRGSLSKVTLISNYSDKYDIKYNGGDQIKALFKAPVAYKITIYNQGEVGGKPVIDISL